MARLAFHGAAEAVTGSKYLLTAGDHRVLVDCGLFQGLKSLRQRNWDEPPFDPAAVDAVAVTHAHLDHIGYLPRLVRLGFRGPILATPATCALAEIILRDSAKIQEQDAEYANRKGYSKHSPALPLYDSEDAERALRQFQAVERSEWVEVAGPIRVRWLDAGHLLGSNLLEVEIEEDRRPVRVVFSGDVGRYGAPLYHDPTPPPACDYLVCESTYGDRDHPDVDLTSRLAEVVLRSMLRGGVLLVASFAVGRAQQLIYLLQTLMDEERIPQIPIYLDSPMAVDATETYRRFRSDHDLSESDLDARRVLAGPRVNLVRSVSESKELNWIDGPAVIISSSGMMTGGRILHHLRQRLPKEKNTILLGGHMAHGTRGRELKEGARNLRMHGRDIPVRAAVEEISGLSGHADRGELLHWLSALEAPPKRVFLTHGEPDAAQALAGQIRERPNWNVKVPQLGDEVVLD